MAARNQEVRRLRVWLLWVAETRYSDRSWKYM